MTKKNFNSHDFLLEKNLINLLCCHNIDSVLLVFSNIRENDLKINEAKVIFNLIFKYTISECIPLSCFIREIKENGALEFFIESTLRDVIVNDYVKAAEYIIIRIKERNRFEKCEELKAIINDDSISPAIHEKILQELTLLKRDYSKIIPVRMEYEE